MSHANQNSLYTLATPDSLAIRVATRVRAEMFTLFMDTLRPTEADTALDIGVTADEAYTSSNYFEDLYPWKHRVTASGLDDARFLETRYPGMRYVPADARALPFATGSFDFVHSSAVIEHVGSAENQARMVAECLRVARRGVCITTPNRWFPIEFHTQMPLLHWLPKPLGRAAFRALGMRFFAEEANLNLLTARELLALPSAHGGWRARVLGPRLLGWPSNLMLIVDRPQTPAH